MVVLDKIKHVFFDLDDTLWDFETNSEKVLKELFVETNLDKKLNNDFYTFLIAYKKRNAELWQLYHHHKITKDELRIKRFYDTFREFNFDDLLFSDQFSNDYVSRSPYGTALKKGSLDLLELLSKKYQLHIITNGFKEVQHIKIDKSGLQKYFTNVLISEELGFNKPDIKIFKEAERCSNASSEQCLMIGDNFETDIRGAQKAGWQSIWYNPQKNKRYQTTQVNCLTELVEFFKEK